MYNKVWNCMSSTFSLPVCVHCMLFCRMKGWGGALQCSSCVVAGDRYCTLTLQMLTVINIFVKPLSPILPLSHIPWNFHRTLTNLTHKKRELRVHPQQLFWLVRCSVGVGAGCWGCEGCTVNWIAIRKWNSARPDGTYCRQHYAPGMQNLWGLQVKVGTLSCDCMKHICMYIYAYQHGC